MASYIGLIGIMTLWSPLLLQYTFDLEMPRHLAMYYFSACVQAEMDNYIHILLAKMVCYIYRYGSTALALKV